MGGEKTQNPDYGREKPLNPQRLWDLHPWRSAACGPDQSQSSPFLSPGTEPENLPA